MQAPACANCIRRNETCEYAGVVDASTTVVTQWHQGATERTFCEIPGVSADHITPIWAGPIDRQPSFPDRGIGNNVAISALLESVMGRSWFAPAEARVWFKVIMDHATRQPYLQHCILSVVYLRWDLHESPSKGRTSAAAYEHQMAASALFRQGATVSFTLVVGVQELHLTSAQPVGPNNWVAILSFHVFTLVFEFGSQSACLENQYNLIDTLSVLRSSHAIEEAAKPYFRASRFWGMIKKRTGAETYVVDQSLQTNLLALGSVIAESTVVHATGAIVNQQALTELRRWVFACEAHPRRWDQYCDWPGHLQPGFLELLASGDDISLLLVIYWSAILYRSQKPVVYSWAKRTAKYAMGRLKERGKWESLLFWPMCILEEIKAPNRNMLVMSEHTTPWSQKHTQDLKVDDQTAASGHQPPVTTTSVAFVDPATSMAMPALTSELTVRSRLTESHSDAFSSVASGVYGSAWPMYSTGTFCTPLSTSTQTSTALPADCCAPVDPFLPQLEESEQTGPEAWHGARPASSMGI
jgi:hypothetical protein